MWVLRLTGFGNHHAQLSAIAQLEFDFTVIFQWQSTGRFGVFSQCSNSTPHENVALLSIVTTLDSPALISMIYTIIHAVYASAQLTLPFNGFSVSRWRNIT